MTALATVSLFAVPSAFGPGDPWAGSASPGEAARLLRAQRQLLEARIRCDEALGAGCRRTGSTTGIGSHSDRSIS